ncbi:hypothetical protein MSAR_37590 [Mycolicibacterium sarraceniae]|uniref:ER-bound oxygenase mpaB/mpaB'/Rubber oxygenase catalytic domain-containing protein n=1 Tax=Mycolicibacterium sarraceniae TaxID=1534348 RepID=A0A7I7SV83_9MYCO|nr:hypothetical protein MSAR_37590 [Mycolicibacterium sarraceniae]
MQWHAMYGMSMKPVPQTWEDFCAHWDRVCRDELEINKATLKIFGIRIPKPGTPGDEVALRLPAGRGTRFYGTP